MKIRLIWPFLVWLVHATPVPNSPTEYRPQNGAITNFLGPAFFVSGTLRVETDSEDHLFIRECFKKFLGYINVLTQTTDKHFQSLNAKSKIILESTKEKINHHLKTLMIRMSTDFFYTFDLGYNAERNQEWESGADETFVNKTRIKTTKMDDFIRQRENEFLENPFNETHTKAFSILNLIESENGTFPLTSHDSLRKRMKRGFFSL